MSKLDAYREALGVPKEDGGGFCIWWVGERGFVAYDTGPEIEFIDLQGVRVLTPGPTTEPQSLVTAARRWLYGLS